MEANAPALEATTDSLTCGRVLEQSDKADVEASLTARAKLEDRFRKSFAERARTDGTQRCDQVA